MSVISFRFISIFSLSLSLTQFSPKTKLVVVAISLNKYKPINKNVYMVMGKESDIIYGLFRLRASLFAAHRIYLA